MIRIPKRLEAISSLVLEDSSILDVGCDHGLLDIYLYQKGLVKKIIASDINQNALNNAKTNILKSKLDDKIETRLGNGLDVLTNEDEIDTVIISGMGCHTILGIIKNNQNKLKKITNIIIQSNTKISLLRKEMMKLNYIIDNEVIVEDNKKIYIIIKFVKGRKKYNKKQLYFGPILLQENSILFQEYIIRKLKKLQIVLKILPKNKIIDRLKIKREIKLYKDLI